MMKIKIPQSKPKETIFLWQGIALFVFAVLFLSGLTILGYWYLFDTKYMKKNQTKAEIEAQRLKPYVYPGNQLGGLIVNKLLNK